MCALSLQPRKPSVARASVSQYGDFKRIVVRSVCLQPRSRAKQDVLCLGLYELAAVDEFKGHTGSEAVGSNGEIWCLAHQILPVSDWGWQLRAPATGWTPPGLTCTFGCHGYYWQVLGDVVALITIYKANVNKKKNLKVHSTDFKHEVQFTRPEKCFIACENSGSMSLVAMEGVLSSPREKTWWGYCGDMWVISVFAWDYKFIKEDVSHKNWRCRVWKIGIVYLPARYGLINDFFCCIMGNVGLWGMIQTRK